MGRYKYPSNFKHLGIIYFLQADLNWYAIHHLPSHQRFTEGPIKIGTTKHPDIRLKQHQAYCPVPLNCIGWQVGSWQLETHLHQRFADLRLHSEWFLPARRLLRYITENCHIWKGE